MGIDRFLKREFFNVVWYQKANHADHWQNVPAHCPIDIDQNNGQLILYTRNCLPRVIHHHLTWYGKLAFRGSQIAGQFAAYLPHLYDSLTGGPIKNKSSNYRGCYFTYKMHACQSCRDTTSLVLPMRQLLIPQIVPLPSQIIASLSIVFQQ